MSCILQKATQLGPPGFTSMFTTSDVGNTQRAEPLIALEQDMAKGMGDSNLLDILLEVLATANLRSYFAISD